MLLRRGVIAELIKFAVKLKFQIPLLNILYMEISAILSDYDGTLSPTTYFYSDDKTVRLTNYSSQMELDRILWEISRKRTIAIVSTKDFNFLHDRTRFAKILSCMMSIETILKLTDSATCYKYRCVQKSMLNVDSKILHKNSDKLESIIDRISLKFNKISIYRKLTFKRNLLGCVTIGVSKIFFF